jgi:hypothetical protein
MLNLIKRKWGENIIKITMGKISFLGYCPDLAIQDNGFFEIQLDFISVGSWFQPLW